MLKFMQNLVGVKFDKAAQAGVEALVRWDPKSASEAEMRTMEQHLDDLGREVAQARRSYDTENKEAEAIPGIVAATHECRGTVATSGRGGDRSDTQGSA